MLCSCRRESDHGVTNFDCTSMCVKDWSGHLQIEKVTPLGQPDSIGVVVAAKCVMSSEGFVLWDARRGTLYSFTLDGEFVRQIGREGRASSEYVNIKDIYLADDGVRLYVMDELGVLSYDVSTGECLGRDKPSLPDFHEYYKLAVLSPGHYLLFNPQAHGLGSIVDYQDGKWRDLRRAGFYQMACERFYRYEGQLRVLSDYGQFFVDTYRDGELCRTFNFHLPAPLPSEKCPKSFGEFQQVSAEGVYYLCIANACETDGWMCASIIGPEQKYYWVFGEKNTGRVLAGLMPVEDGMQVVGSDGRSFYALVYPELVSHDSHMQSVIGTKHSQGPFLVKFTIRQ